MESVKEKVKETAQKVKAEAQEMMKVYKELGTPGEPHRNLSRLAGKWKTTTKAWSEPGSAPEMSSGTSEKEILFDGRYLQEKDQGQMMGAPYTGIAITAFDNNTKKYQTVWLDSMSTNISVFEGAASTDEKTVTQTSSYNDPVRGPMTMRIETVYVDDDNHVFTMYSIDKSGKEFKMMETTYTRIK